jgi:hypothetical protein
MTEKKDIQIKVRITATDKETIESYCEAHSITISDFLRAAIYKKLKENKENE